MTPEEDWVRNIHTQTIRLYSTFLDLCPLVHTDKHRSCQKLEWKEHWPRSHTLDLSLDTVTASI